MDIPHRCMRTIQTFARQRISCSGVCPGCCPFSAHYNWHWTQWLLLMTGARIPAGGGRAARSRSPEWAPLHWEYEVISIFQQERPQWIQSSLQMERQQLAKAKSVIKTIGLTLIQNSEAPLKDFQCFFSFEDICSQTEILLHCPLK